MIYHAIKHLFPGIEDHQFLLQDDSDGRGPYIAKWDHPSPQPTPQQIQAAIAVLPPEWAARLREEFKAEREELLNRMMGLASRKHRQGDTALSAALDWMAEAIIPLDAHPHVVAESKVSYDAGRAAYIAVYGLVAKQALGLAPNDATRLAWKLEIDKVFK
jgi:hypothetical protein